MANLFSIIIILFSPLFLHAGSFEKSKKILSNHLELFDYKTLYCGCKTVGNKKIDIKSCGYRIQKNEERALRLEWEHVVPAEAFGNNFKEWRFPKENCGLNSGRKCAKKNPKFDEMEGDLYNLVPEVGELNGLRSNFSMAELGESTRDFGGCQAKLNSNKFSPMNKSKGVVARIYMNMDNRYPGMGIISDKNRKLFEAWDNLYPVTELECRRWRVFSDFQGYQNLFIKRCSKFLPMIGE